MDLKDQKSFFLFLDVVDWHLSSGGFCKSENNLPGHAIRLLHEVVELCIACGASPSDMTDAVNKELDKAFAKNKFKNLDSVGEECADCQILLYILANYANISLTDNTKRKLSILKGRRWEADENGVLWRPSDG